MIMMAPWQGKLLDLSVWRVGCQRFGDGSKSTKYAVQSHLSSLKQRFMSYNKHLLEHGGTAITSSSYRMRQRKQAPVTKS